MGIIIHDTAKRSGLNPNKGVINDKVKIDLQHPNKKGNLLEHSKSISFDNRTSRPIIPNISEDNNDDVKSETSCVNRRIIGYKFLQIQVYEEDEFYSSIGSSARMMIARGEMSCLGTRNDR